MRTEARRAAAELLKAHLKLFSGVGLALPTIPRSRAVEGRREWLEHGAPDWFRLPPDILALILRHT